MHELEHGSGGPSDALWRPVLSQGLRLLEAVFMGHGRDGDGRSEEGG